jgi:hypothetical protein
MTVTFSSGNKISVALSPHTKHLHEEGTMGSRKGVYFFAIRKLAILHCTKEMLAVK